MYTRLDTVWRHIEPSWKYFWKMWNRFLVIVSFLLVICIFIVLSMNTSQKVYVVVVKNSSEAKFVTSPKFLSVALDTSLIANGLNQYHLRNPRFIKLLRALSPAYLRIGGTMADRLTFSPTQGTSGLWFTNFVDGGLCSNEKRFCHVDPKPNFTMNAKDWLLLNDLARNAQLDMIFDLNALKRNANGTWDYINAKKLIAFSYAYNLRVNWELGNEPNAYQHQFNYTVSPEQLSKDFQTLRSILNMFPKYSRSLLIGPDVTRPDVGNTASELYLKKFLAQNSSMLDAITWHQYYFNGVTAKINDFLDPKNFDILQWQINVVKDILKNASVTKELWLGETSSAYGGGAPHLSDRFIATFLWLDKLGMAARSGLSVVIRQTAFKGNYALINDNFYPTPDWWISVLYKKLVSNKVVDCQFVNSEKIRLYCQCTKKLHTVDSIPSITVFGLNLNKHKVKIRFEGITNETETLFISAYVLTTRVKLDSRFILLNEEVLHLTETFDVPKLEPKMIKAFPHVEMPPLSLAFWVIPVKDNLVPYC